MHGGAPTRGLFLVLAVSLTSGVGHAQPVVRVRAETRIELRVERGEGEVSVDTTLRDDRGEPLPDRPIEVRIAESNGLPRGEHSDLTDAEGRVSAPFPVAPGAYRITATFRGEERYLGVEVSQNLDLLRAHVRLGMSLDSEGRLDRLDLDRERHEIRVRADSEEGGAGLPIELTDETAEVLARGTTDASGSIVLTVESDRLGEPAAGRLIVSTPGDARRAPAQTEVLVVRYRATNLTLSADRDRIEASETVRVEGRLADSRAALARKAVGLFAGDLHLATVLTDDEGRFERTLEMPTASREDDTDPEREVIALSARFDSDAPWRPSARSQPVEIVVEVPTGTAYLWVLGTAFIFGVLALLISRRDRARPAAVPTGERPSLPAPPGFVPAAPRTRVSDRKDVGGRVLDADEGIPLSAVTITLRGPGGEHAVESDPDGQFLFAELAPGRFTLHVAREGYRACETAVEIPHRGEWSMLEVRISSLREVVLRAYRPVAEALAPDRKWWGFWTLGELVRRAQPEHRAPVAALTEAVERVAYGAPPADPSRVDEIVKEAEGVARALRDAPPPG